MREALKLNDADAELHGMLGGLLKRKGGFRASPDALPKGPRNRS